MTRRTRIELWLFLVALTSGSLTLWWLWLPQHVVWARNAYAMSLAGVYEGAATIGASIAYWFIALYGRTVVSVAFLLIAIAWGMKFSGISIPKVLDLFLRKR